jgi:hypothetical protein
LSFDGITGRVRVPDAAQLEPAGAFTASAWVKAQGSPGAYKYILAKGASGCVAASYGLYTGANGGVVFYVSNGTSYSLSPDAGTGVWDGAWHYVAGVYDGSAVHLYVDGTEVGSGTPATSGAAYGLPSGNDLFIGHYDGCGGLDFAGTIDEPRIWTAALPAVQLHAQTYYRFGGFYQPVDNTPTLNVAKGGSAIPVKFTLGSNQGMGILAAGSPSSQQVACDTDDPTDAIEQTVAATSSTLQYDPTTNQYTYVWKTSPAWSGTCRRLDVSLTDGSTHSALFRFK